MSETTPDEAVGQCWAVIPIKAPGEGKTRLSSTLGTAEREDLVGRMLRQVVAVAQSSLAIDRVFIAGPSRHGLDASIPLLDDPGGGLNAAVQRALSASCNAGAARLVILAADLPCIAPDDANRLAALPNGTIGIAPDRHGTGTNAISLPLPGARDFHFMFGPQSLERHRREACRLGHNVKTIISPGLEKDIDDPADLADAGWKA